MINRVIKGVGKGKMSEKRREWLKRLIESSLRGESEVSERMRKGRQCAVKSFSEVKMGERRGRIVEGLIEVIPKCEMSDRRREIFDGAVKNDSKSDVSKRMREFLKIKVELIPQM